MHIFIVFPLKSADESLPKGQAGDGGEEFSDRLTVKMEKRNKSGAYVPTCAIGSREF